MLGQEPRPFDAAVAPRLSADRYGLDVLADDIGDAETVAEPHCSPIASPRPTAAIDA
jgi:hypothetical protein